MTGKSKTVVTKKTFSLKSLTKQHINMKIVVYLCLIKENNRFNVVQIVILQNDHQPINQHVCFNVYILD